MKTLQEWIDSDLKELKKVKIQDYNNEVFHRDPCRTQIIDNQFFFSPADGTILYCQEVGPGEEIVEIKGQNFTLENLMQRPVNFRALVIGIFLSQFDVHVTRIPTAGFFYYRKLDKITTMNRPMLHEEEDIFDGIIDKDAQGYSFINERYLQTVDMGEYRYWMVAIADRDIDVIAHHKESGSFLSQNTRSATIKWGSQVCLILPISDNMKFEPMVSRAMHVEAGVDPVVRILPIDRVEVLKGMLSKLNSVNKSDPVKKKTNYNGIKIDLEVS